MKWLSCVHRNRFNLRHGEWNPWISVDPTNSSTSWPPRTRTRCDAAIRRRSRRASIWSTASRTCRTSLSTRPRPTGRTLPSFARTTTTPSPNNALPIWRAGGSPIMTIFLVNVKGQSRYFEKLIRKLYVGTRKLGATPSILKGTNDSFKHSRYLFSQKDARSLNCLNFYFKSTPHVLLGQFWKNKIVA